jgi:hypothetical protein
MTDQSLGEADFPLLFGESRFDYFCVVDNAERDVVGAARRLVTFRRPGRPARRA